MAPVQRVETQGRPIIMASSRAFGMPSTLLDSTKQAASAVGAWMSSTTP